MKSLRILAMVGLATILLLLTSCKDDSLFVKKYADVMGKKVVKSFSFDTDNYYLLDKVQRSFKKFGFNSSKKSKYHIYLTSHYVINCKNPVIHALGADFNGFIRLSLFRNKKELYRIQKDFKTRVTNDMIDNIVKRFLEDNGFQPAKAG